MGVVQYAILNDIHFPFEAKAYYTALSQMQSWPALREIFLNGDIAEIESVSSHPRGPLAERLLINELEYTNKKFDQLQNLFPKIPVNYISGNHEYRVYRYLRDVAPQLWGMLSMPELFKFKERGWMFHDYSCDQLVKCGKAKGLYVRHEPLVGGVNHAKGTAEKSVVSIIYGHTHVYQQYSHKKFGPSPYLVTAMSNGFLGNIKADCFNYRGSKDNWINGFARVDVDERTGEYEARFVAL